MRRFKTLLFALAATGLAVGQPAAAAARTGATLDNSEALEAGAAPVVGLIALVGLVFAIMAITDDSDPSGFPTSP